MSTNHVSSSYSSEDELSSLSSPPPEANAMDTDNIFDINIGANGGNGDGDGKSKLPPLFLPLLLPLPSPTCAQPKQEGIIDCASWPTIAV